MDPDAAWDALSEANSTAERDQAALDLLVWLANGGAMPGTTGTSRALSVRRGSASSRRAMVAYCELRLSSALDRAS